MAKTHASAARAPRTTPRIARATSAATKAPAARPASGRPAAKRTTPARLPKAVTTAIAAAQDRKAQDIVVLDLRKAGGFTDFFVICTGNNPRHITAIADAVRDTLKKQLDERPALAEGVDKSEWILLDYFNFVVHIFSRDCRSFYALERLWGAADRIDFPDEP